jgi:hypothetical protein
VNTCECSCLRCGTADGASVGAGCVSESPGRWATARGPARRSRHRPARPRPRARQGQPLPPSSSCQHDRPPGTGPWRARAASLSQTRSSLNEWGRSRGCCALFFGFPALSRHAGSRAGVKVERPAGRTTLRPVLLPATLRGPGTGVWLWCAPGAASGCRQAPGCGHPFGVPAGAGRGCMGRSACGQRDQSEARPRRRWRGPDLGAITRCPCPGLAHAASVAAVRAARDLACPSRIA